MRPNPQFPAALVTFTEEILNGKLQFLCCVGGERWVLRGGMKLNWGMAILKIFDADLSLASIMNFILNVKSQIHNKSISLLK